MSQGVRDLLEILAQAWGPRSWHGTGLAGAVRGVSAEEALWRPGPARHNVWELALHLAYWKYVVVRRLTGAPKGSFPRPGSDWIEIAEPTESGWREDVRLLHDQHKALVQVVKSFPVSRLDRKVKSRWTNRQHILGVAAHDLYHTGQIQLVKKLARQQLNTPDYLDK